MSLPRSASVAEELSASLGKNMRHESVPRRKQTRCVDRGIVRRNVIATSSGTEIAWSRKEEIVRHQQNVKDAAMTKKERVRSHEKGPDEQWKQSGTKWKSR